MKFVDLGTIGYRQAWDQQHRAHEKVMNGGEEIIFFLEHTPVITLGRQSQKSAENLLFSADELEARGIELIESDRGGNVTFHGPGQLVVYPIIRLIDYTLSVGAYVRLLQEGVIEALFQIGIESELSPANVGVWAREKDNEIAPLAKVCAVGVRVKRGVTMHGLALNLTTNLNYFQFINPCGLSLPVTSVLRLTNQDCAAIAPMKVRLATIFRQKLDSIRRTPS